jgi:predicted kinase
MEKLSKKDLLQWFQTNEKELYKLMYNTEHGYMGIEPNPYHMEGSVLSHTKMVMDQATKFDEIEIIISALLHDIGKTNVWVDNHESKRRRFTNHEAMSVFMAKPILKKLQKEYVFDMKAVLKTIGSHGCLYNYFKDGRINPKYYTKIASMFTVRELEMLRDFYVCDHEGRIQEVPKGDIKDVIKDFNTIIDIINESYDGTHLIPEKTITIMIGCPRPGKSTFLEDRIYAPENMPVIISRDKLVMEYGSGKTYSEKWKSLSDSKQKEIDKELMKRFHDAIKLGRNISVDMTNMSKKSRRKWLSDNKVKDYYKVAQLFIEPKEVLMSRMSDDKNIPEKVIDSMMRSFVFPDYSEFDRIVVH